jgi:hypothetical protein
MDPCGTPALTVFQDDSFPFANMLSKALDEGKEIRVIFFDISKAFDRVWHRGLLFK